MEGGSPVAQAGSHQLAERSHTMGILGWIILGLIAGAIASLADDGRTTHPAS